MGLPLRVLVPKSVGSSEASITVPVCLAAVSSQLQVSPEKLLVSSLLWLLTIINDNDMHPKVAPAEYVSYQPEADIGQLILKW